ncbi:hypothetical protein [Nannocystis punicea]|uniref:Uncharacterized protein n=1 Tax=Nannocystis punicea TaxID=2995304 RepID=A0ABY7H8U9_9BACT|nr:hypothetical protein [Nannocystis poenicansa]WAS95699.1 hypothetical protein O0S08_06010 [Nannocystis poenicansa]
MHLSSRPFAHACLAGALALTACPSDQPTTSTAADTDGATDTSTSTSENSPTTADATSTSSTSTPTTGDTSTSTDDTPDTTTGFNPEIETACHPYCEKFVECKIFYENVEDCIPDCIDLFPVPTEECLEASLVSLACVGELTCRELIMEGACGAEYAAQYEVCPFPRKHARTPAPAHAAASPRP